MPSSHLILCRPLLLLPPIPPNIRVFSNESTLCMGWPKCWSFSFSISPSNEYSGLISFRIDWLDLLAVQGALKSLPQHHSSEASTLQCSAFLTVQLSHPYMTVKAMVFPVVMYWCESWTVKKAEHWRTLITKENDSTLENPGRFRGGCTDFISMSPLLSI